MDWHTGIKTISWMKAILMNDEHSTNQELIQLFITEGKLSEQAAKNWVGKRGYYLTHIKLGL